MSSTQMLKGILEGCLLAVISEGEIYGYEMTKVLAGYGFSDISEGSIYPILLRMQKEKWVETELKRSASGPKRKYYRLTPLGEAGFNRSSTVGKHYPGTSMHCSKKTEGEVKLCYQRTCKTYWTR